ncbi:P68 family surface lipoprotein [Mycoplasma todarodis]|uniref:Sugar ABC transporter substrate-binding protein n=1 Tax=Mycoplasma todarodis TaxID=1937191 RepID=A0A4R0XKZ5_9MOLU|nr:P80 family lipoprotein [Mycoplasma todarodis]TCG11313.1 hypothetical protein C4B25_01870 [Mycoplasma todarodis]
MKKFKKIGLTVTAAAVAVAAPVATVISCGKSSDKNDNVVLIKAGWAKNGPQFKAFQKVVDRYNATNPKFKVKFQNIEGGYGKIAPLELRDIKQKHMGPVSDLFIDYPDAVGQLAAQGAQLDLSDLGANSVKRSDFEKQFMGVNDNIGGIKNHKQGKSIYEAPIAASTEMLSADMPVMQYILKQLAAAGAKVTGIDTNGKIDPNAQVGSDTLLGQILNFKESPEDTKEIKHIWGTISGTYNNVEIKADTFTDYKKIADFSATVQEAFGKDASSESYVLGIDAPTNTIYNTIFGLNNYDMKEFFSQKDEFTSFLDGSGANAKKIKDGLRIFEKAVQTGGVKFQGGGAYSSSDLVEHRAALTWGSTAGYSHNFTGAMSHKTKIDGKMVDLGSHTKEVIKSYKDSTGKTITASGDIVGYTNDKHHNKVYANNVDSSKVGKYDKKLSADATKLFKAAPASENTIGWLSSAKGLKDTASIKEAYVVAGKYHYFAIEAKAVKTDGHDAGKTLQQKEVAFAKAPKTVNGGKKTTTMIQGPSLIGIKHGGQKDIETGKFVKWFFTTKDTIKDGDREYTPVKYFDKHAQYITPTAGAFKDAKSDWDKGNALAYKAFHDMTQDSKNNFGFQAPVNRLSSTLRKNVFDVALKDSWSVAMHSNPKATIGAEDIYAQIKKLYEPYSK